MAPRFSDFSDADDRHLIELYHIGHITGDTRHARLCWAAREFCKERPDVQPIRAYKELCSTLEHKPI
jgi:hypothetical protein